LSIYSGPQEKELPEIRRGGLTLWTNRAVPRTRNTRKEDISDLSVRTQFHNHRLSTCAQSGFVFDDFLKFLLHFILDMILFSGRVSFSEIEFLRL
jgi:hypothetical protein